MYYGKLIDNEGNMIAYQVSPTPFVYTDKFIPMDETEADKEIQEFEQHRAELKTQSLKASRQAKLQEYLESRVVKPGQVIEIEEEDIEEEEINDEK